MARTAQISKEKQQSIITLRHEGQSIWISRTLKVSSSAVTKFIKHYDETDFHKDRHRKGTPINASQSSSNRHIPTSTVQRRLRESGLHSWISAKKPLLKDTNNNKRLDWLILIGRLNSLGFSNDCLAWFTNYFADWVQCVKSEGMLSGPLTVSMGVPQGSILGPTLYSVYINDVALAAGDSLIHLYADDTIRYTSGPSLGHCAN